MVEAADGPKVMIPVSDKLPGVGKRRCRGFVATLGGHPLLDLKVPVLGDQLLDDLNVVECPHDQTASGMRALEAAARFERW